ncbi:hypothetical protein [Castellaniella sp.]|uniref:hypothetical protein n=1 Tax=Castellaniella sp. TaxID=1955812 RepID=UPI002AFED348|nr:hypothetical protein [Castellaniella sp.]
MQEITNFKHIEELHEDGQCNHRFFVIAGKLYEVHNLPYHTGMHNVVEVYDLGEDAFNFGMHC